MPILLRSHQVVRAGLTAGFLGALLAGSAGAQQKNATKAAPPAAPTKPAAPANMPALVQTVVPTKPTDPIAVINGEPITRGQLADECVSQHGVEVLETMIARKLVQQAVAAKNLSITAAEIDKEIERNAAASGLSREQFLRMLAKERNISPRQYADYIAYPSLALRKLAEPRVQVTEKDIEEAYQANYGDKLRCRVIMVDQIQKAKDIWNEIRANPGGFAKIAQERSIDSATASMGGLLPQPIVRFANPRNVSEAAFTQLVDGDPNDKNPAHKPKDGDFTGPIQVAEGAWIILQRVGVDPATPVDRNDPKIAAQMKQLIHEAKLESEMSTVMEELLFESAIDNHLTGQTKLARQQEEQVKVDGGIQRMSQPSTTPPSPNSPSQSAPPKP